MDDNSNRDPDISNVIKSSGFQTIQFMDDELIRVGIQILYVK